MNRHPKPLPPPPNGPGHGRTKGSKNKLTKERVEKELRHIAFSNCVDLFERAHKGRRVFRLRELTAMPEGVQRAIASMKVRRENLTAGDGARDTTVEVKLWDKTKALELCARALGMLKDHIVVEGLDARKEHLREALAKVPPREDPT